MRSIVPYHGQSVGGTNPIYITPMRGSGFGNTMSAVFRNLIVPTAKTVGKSLLKTGLKKTSGVLSGIADGKRVKDAVLDELGIGSGTPSRTVKRKRKRVASKKNVKRAKTASNIFE